MDVLIKMTPLISIILTSYNKPLTVGNSIESVLSQTYENWELFIMDDNSNEETVNIITDYLGDSRIHYINSQISNDERYKTTRYATLINKAIHKTKGNYITYLTDDNIFLPGRLEKMVHYLQSNINIEIVYSKQLVKWVDEFPGKPHETVRRTYGIINKPAGLVDHCSVMHTREISEQVFRKHGSYWDDHPDNWNFGDSVFWNRLTEFKPFYPIPKILDVSWKGEDSFQRLYTHMPATIPDGTLIRGLGCDIFLVENQKRRKLHPKTFISLKYDSNLIVRIPDPFLFKYPEGDPIDDSVFENFEIFPKNRIIASDNNTLYYTQNNKKYLISNENVFYDYKFYKIQPTLINDSLLQQFPDGPSITEISNSTSFLPEGVLYKCQNDYYIYLNQHLHHVEENVAQKLKLSVTDSVIINSDILSRFKKGDPFVWKQ